MIRYIALEGIDGAGKTTQMKELCGWLMRDSYTPIPLCEPSYGKYGVEIRTRMQEGAALSLPEQVKLFCLDRQEHVESKIDPLLKFMVDNTGFVIVQDRYYLSLPAYQAREETEILHLLTIGQNMAPRPDIVFLLDVSVSTALHRLGSARRNRLGSARRRFDLLEQESVLNRARSNYLFLANEGSEAIELINAEASHEDVHRQIVDVLSQRTSRNATS